MNPPAAAKARSRGATIWQGTLEEVEDVPWGSFDAVFSWDSIEHTPTPREFATRLHALMAPGASGEITTLNLHSLAWKLLGMRWSMVTEDHFTYWSDKSLRGLLEDVGLHVAAVYYFGVGRDLVAFMDRARRFRPPNAGQSQAGAAPPPAWDTRTTVLAAENAANQTRRDPPRGRHRDERQANTNEVIGRHVRRAATEARCSASRMAVVV